MSEYRGRVLLVDDDRNVAIGLKEILERYLFYVRVAHTVDAAFAEMVWDTFDVVVVDWIIPGGQGGQVLEFIEQYYPEVATVVYSAYPNTDAESTAYGVHQFIEKGPSIEPVRNAVERGIQMAEANRKRQGEAAYRTCLYDRWFIDALRDEFHMPNATRGNLGIVSVPCGLPGALLLWMAGCQDEHTGPVLVIDGLEIPPGSFSEAIVGRGEAGIGRRPILKRGLAEYARGGSLCVRHVDRMHSEDIVTLARVTQSGIIKRLGSEREIPTSFRLVVTMETTESPDSAISGLAQELRAVIQEPWFVVPPIGTSNEVLPRLAQRMLNLRSAGRQEFESTTLLALRMARFPVTVADLKFAIERAHETCMDRPVELEDLGIPLLHESVVQLSGEKRTIKKWTDAKDAFGASYFARLLSETGGNVTYAAELSGLGRQAVYQYLKKYNIVCPSD